jgi:lipid-A-disaccharide synthase-like uncharacterized protein
MGLHQGATQTQRRLNFTLRRLIGTLPRLIFTLRRLTGTLPRLIFTLRRLTGTLPRLIFTLRRLTGTLPRLIFTLRRLTGTLPRLIFTLRRLIGTLPRLIFTLRRLIKILDHRRHRFTCVPGRDEVAEDMEVRERPPPEITTSNGLHWGRTRERRPTPFQQYKLTLFPICQENN